MASETREERDGAFVSGDILRMVAGPHRFHMYITVHDRDEDVLRSRARCDGELPGEIGV